MNEFAVVIVNWNGGRLAVDSVGSFVTQTVEPEVWVIDNGSTDGSCEAIAVACPQAHLIRNEHNRGYAPAVNQGLVSPSLPIPINLLKSYVSLDLISYKKRSILLISVSFP